MVERNIPLSTKCSEFSIYIIRTLLCFFSNSLFSIHYSFVNPFNQLSIQYFVHSFNISYLFNTMPATTTRPTQFFNSFICSYKYLWYFTSLRYSTWCFVAAKTRVCSVGLMVFWSKWRRTAVIQQDRCTVIRDLYLAAIYLITVSDRLKTVGWHNETTQAVLAHWTPSS